MARITVHTVLKRLLAERKMSISQLAKLSGAPHSTLSTWLSPNARPKDPEQIAAVARALGTTMHILLFDEPEQEIDIASLATQHVLDGLYRLRLERVLLPSETKKKG